MSDNTEISKRLNLFVERLIMDPVLQERYRAEPYAVLDQFGIEDEKTKAAMVEGEFENILPLRLHPILAMHYQLSRSPEVASHMTIRYYPELAGALGKTGPAASKS
jgi:5,10-methenyltetrahydromethanopterin hydrogenase